jgi:hypothetical protein
MVNIVADRHDQFLDATEDAAPDSFLGEVSKKRSTMFS